MRSLITSIIGILLIAGAVLVFNKISADKEKNKPVPTKAVTAVYSTTVENQNNPIFITTSGQLVAKNKVQLFSEVQGIFERSSRDFKPGVYYKKGEILLKLNSAEYFAGLQAQKSGLYNQIVGLLPDLQLDFPESLPNWKAYLAEFDMDMAIAPLPEPLSEKEKLFIAGRNIQTTWYNIKNLQVRLSKYTIYAPFSGILTEADVTPGTLVRAGQKLGEFISPTIFEMEVPVNMSLEKRLKVGKQVALHDLEKTTTWNGKVIRISGKVDPTSQTTKIFIQVSGEGLKEGMYLEAEIKAKDEENTFEIDRKLLIDENKVFVIADTLLQIKEITPVFFNENTVVVSGLENGSKILSKPVPGAFAGMAVKILED
jgi:multidrug efflux pump subunit AcrA (membrane-fusion protein)